MKLSTKGRYGTRVLVDLAMHRDAGLVLLKDVAQRQDISLRYLEHIITPLVTAGIVRSTRGARGGVFLARSPEKITLLEVIQILEGSTAPVECVDSPEVCRRNKTCATRDIWTEVKLSVDRVLEATTLEDLIKKQKAKEQPEPLMYYV
jgi:Rrf2 family transcriptional regulator, cysteine metabolism repressor